MLPKNKETEHLLSLNKELLQSRSSTNISRQSDAKVISKKIFAIASSAGGPQALEVILSALPEDFSVPIVIAQHISQGFSGEMADWLNKKIRLAVKVADHGEPIVPGHVYMSPAEYHMAINSKHQVTFTSDVEYNLYHPSCDLLLKSVAASYGKYSVGIICSGMGNDGVAGMEKIYASGGTTIAQDEQSSLIFGMNQEAIANNCIEHILPLEAIPWKMLTLSGY